MLVGYPGGLSDRVIINFDVYTCYALIIYCPSLQKNFFVKHILRFLQISGKKRIRVDGYVQHQQQVFRGKNFMYSWPLRNHLIAVIPVPERSGGETYLD